MPQTAETLSRVPLFAHLGAEELERLASVTQRRTYRRDAVIANPGDERDRLFVITDGSARLYAVSQFGRAIALATLQSGDVYGLVYGPDMNTRCLLRSASGPTVVYCPTRDAVEALLATHVTVARTAFAQCAELLREAFALIEDMAFECVEVRLAHLLARTAVRDEHRIVLATHQELASLIGASREEVTRSLISLRERQLVEYGPERRRIVVPDPEKLASFADLSRRPDDSVPPV